MALHCIIPLPFFFDQSEEKQRTSTIIMKQILLSQTLSKNCQDGKMVNSCKNGSLKFSNMKGFVGKLNKMQIFLKNHTFCCHALIDKFNLLPKLTHIAQKIWCQLKICISNLHRREFNTENFIDDLNTKQTNRGPEGEGYLDR